ncbi:hypothetical protein [Thaumasiovibrio subtropicus]|uniref:hypothetical protein n=1 Tax=Thaumasiovibrio subtropicus TaxID=1891207 RepID=UPI000B35D740|nr:hypothetical protein [Thaumasiovibrio subtropicus]
MTRRAFYSAPIAEFMNTSADHIIGVITSNHTQQLRHEQTSAWHVQTQILQQALNHLDVHDGHVFFEFLIPRMGKRADIVIVLNGVIYVIEFKVGASQFHAVDIRQTVSYALDLKHFHRGSHSQPIIPILVATKAASVQYQLRFDADNLAKPIKASQSDLSEIIAFTSQVELAQPIDAVKWADSGYLPTPTIIEAVSFPYTETV